MKSAVRERDMPKSARIAGDGEWALVTGASSGLGMEFARELAARRINLVLTARREQPMQQLAEQLKRQHGIRVVIESADLAESGNAAALKAKLDAQEIAPSILINNAAFGISGYFADQSPDRMKAMLHLNIVSLTELTHLFGKAMLARGHGHILLVASMAALGPTPLLSAYGASKAYVLSLGEALHVEFGAKVGVTVLSPGLMDTEFNAVSGYEAPDSALIRKTKLTPAKVAQIGLKAMFARKPHVIAGNLNRFIAFVAHFVSRHTLARTSFDMAKKAPLT
jgi:uncharacterized protein